MFSGIIRIRSRVIYCHNSPDACMTVGIEYDSTLMPNLSRGDSVSVNGVCLTVVDFVEHSGHQTFLVNCSPETISRTAPLYSGKELNLELSLRMGDEIGGHYVTGHVDCVGEIAEYTLLEDNANHLMRIVVPANCLPLLAPKGSVSIDGVSMTINGSDPSTSSFHVNVIPYTRENTNFSSYVEGTKVNIELDMMARYLGHWLESRFEQISG